MTTKEKLREIVISNPHAPTSVPKKIGLINEVLSASGSEKQFREKRGGFYGIHGTKLYDNKSMWRSLYGFIMQMPYNIEIYDTMVIFGFLPKHHPGDLVMWKRDSRIDAVIEVHADLFGGFYYITRECGGTRTGKALESYIVAAGVWDEFELKPFGKAGDILSGVDLKRLEELMLSHLSLIDLPEGAVLDCDLSKVWYGGYGLANTSAYIRWSGSEEDEEAHRGEIRFHFRRNGNDQWCATLYWKHGSLYQSWDLFEKYHSYIGVSRFVYGDTIGAVLSKSVQQINRVLRLEKKSIQKSA